MPASCRSVSNGVRRVSLILLGVIESSLRAHSWREVKEVLATGKEGLSKFVVLLAAVTVSEVL